MANEREHINSDSIELSYSRTKTYKEEKVRTWGDIVRSVVDVKGNEHSVPETRDWSEVCPGVETQTRRYDSRTGSMHQTRTETTLRIQRTAAPITIHVDDVYDYRLGERTSYEKSSRTIVVKPDQT